MIDLFLGKSILLDMFDISRRFLIDGFYIHFRFFLVVFSRTDLFQENMRRDHDKE